MNIQQIFILILILLTLLMTWYLIGAQEKKGTNKDLKERLMAPPGVVNLN
jgi:regulatory protein YycI of two-component signal transduction system YycFG